MSYAVGPGLLARMQQYGTSPATREDYRPSPSDWDYSEALGQDGRRYVYLKATGQVLVFDPTSWMSAGDLPAPIAQPSGAPVVVQQVASPNYTAGRQGRKPIAIVLHTMGGSLAGTDSWFANPSSSVSAHFGVGLKGDVHQYVDLANMAWANGILETMNCWPGPGSVNPNLLSVSIETEDLGVAAQAVTPAQYAAVLGCARLALAAYPTIVWLLGHNDISPVTRSNCPGGRWRANGKFDQLARELGLKAVGG